MDTISRFSPREDLRRRLQVESKKHAGFPFYDVRWSTVEVRQGADGKRVEIPGRDCLCIYEKDRRGNETIRMELRADPTEPDATKTFCYTTPSGEERETTMPLDEGDDGYVEKVLGVPRQINEADVEEAISAAKHAVKRSHELVAKFKKIKEDQKKEQARIREEYTMAAAEDISKAMWALRTGKNPFVDYGARSEKKYRYGRGYCSERQKEGAIDDYRPG